jgi:UDP-N-acetylglucosamine 2-epimerase (non-hydrolysing)
MSKKKVMIVAGTRPEAIKLAPVALELAKRPAEFEPIICATGQHREMFDQALGAFGLRPSQDLALMKPGQRLGGLTADCLNGMDRVLAQEKPDIVLVQGDTTTAFAAALAAYYLDVRVAHVEAGLRTWKKREPFPEEINRRLIGPIADLHFAPTEGARQNLLREGIDPASITVTGNTAVDAILIARDLLAANPSLAQNTFPGAGGAKVVLVTAHRRESFGEGLRQICQALRALALARPDTLIVYPVHLNPNVQAPVRGALSALPNVRLLPPLDYLSFVACLERADIILTDSGGIQEEAPSLGKPVLVMREVSERPEAIAAGTAILTGTDPARILAAVGPLLDDPAARRQMAARRNPYGDGHAAERIARALAVALDLPDAGGRPADAQA